jgi:hypothetical protein
VNDFVGSVVKKMTRFLFRIKHLMFISIIKEFAHVHPNHEFQHIFRIKKTSNCDNGFVFFLLNSESHASLEGI